MNLKEVVAALVTLALNRAMDKIVGIDIAKGKDYSVVTDWAILADGSRKLMKETKVWVNAVQFSRLLKQLNSNLRMLLLMLISIAIVQ